MTKRNTLCFVSSNSYKFREFRRLFLRHGIHLDHVDIPIPEIQTFNMNTIIRDKVVKAYRELGQPLMVDHSGLAMTALNDLPQGLNKQFWEILKDKVCYLATELHDNGASILVSLGFCDGYRIHTVDQRDPGRIATRPSPKGPFHLDRVFIPQGSSKTVAEMSAHERDSFSYRRKAFDRALELLKPLALGKELGLR